LFGSEEPRSVPAVSSVKQEQGGWEPKKQRRRYFREADMLEREGKREQGYEEIAIIGMSGRYPQARDLRSYWENLKVGKDCITEIPQERWDHRMYFDAEKGKLGKSYSKWGGFIDGVDEFDSDLFNIPPSQAELMDPQERLFLQTVWNLFEATGYTKQVRRQLYDNKIGVYVGAMYHAPESETIYHAFTSLSSNSSIANRVSNFFDLQGPSLAIDTMSSSAAVAIHMACQSLISGECRLALAGGVNLSIHPRKYVGLSQLRMIGSHAMSRPFGQGDGYIPAEALGAVLLKPLTKAVHDGDAILAVIKATATNHAGRSSGYCMPNPKLQGELFTEAFAKAQINPDTISYIEMAANGAALADAIELRALKTFFQKHTANQKFCGIGSVKTSIGHAEAASAMTQLSKVVLQLQHRTLVPSLIPEEFNPHMSFEDGPFYYQATLAEWRPPMNSAVEGIEVVPRRALVNSFGVGGTSVSMILEEYSSSTATAAQRWDSRPYVMVFSAKNEDRLRLHIAQVLEYILAEKDVLLSDLAYTLQLTREEMDSRVAFVVRDELELHKSMNKYLGTTDQNLEEESPVPIFTGDVKRSHAQFVGFAKEAVAADVMKVLFKEQSWEDIAYLWAQGATVPWDILYGQRKLRILPIPKYPFNNYKYRPLSAASGLREDAHSDPTRITGATTKSSSPAFSSQELNGARPDVHHEV
jgi:polyketide synthase PksN